jgi:hypothetical protein
VDDDGASDGGSGDAGDGGGGDGQPADGGTPGKPPLPRPTPPKQAGKPGGDWRPPTREEWEAQTKAGRLAAREAKERKEELRKLKLESASETERREAELVDRTRAETEGAWRPRVVTHAAKAALAAAGCKAEDDITRLARLIDRDQVTVEDDGTVTGLDEQVAALVVTYAESFRPARRQAAGGHAPAPADDGVVNPGPGRASGKKMTTSERQAAAMHGRRPGR